MALSKSVPQPTGIACTYHRILRGIVDFTNGHTTVEAASYVSKEARDAGAAPITGFSTTFEQMPTFTGDPRPWAYDLLKQRPEWADATDV